MKALVYLNLFFFFFLLRQFGLLQIKLSEARGRPIAFNKFRYTLFATHGFIFGLQLLYRPSSPLLLVFIGPGTFFAFLFFAERTHSLIWYSMQW
jgi:hypothetical protein